MAEIEYIGDHGEIAAENLPTALHSAETIEGLVRALSSGAQMLEDQLFDLLVSTYLTTARGDQLDQWGVLAGEPRRGLRDDEYRVFIRGRIMANASESTPPDLIEIFQVLTAPSVVRLWELHPKAYHLTAYRREPLADELLPRIASVMDDARPTGTEGVISESTWDALESGDDQTLQPGGFSRLIQ